MSQAFPASERKRLVRVKGTLMFADLSGFTAMSDRLNEAGRMGAEELTSIINETFDPLLEIIFSFGGDVIKFGGDAVLVLFRGEDHTQKAIACGQALLVKIGPAKTVKATAGEFPIGIHIGISRGSATSVIVGKRGKQFDHLFCGTDVSKAYEAADNAESGEIYVTGNCLPYLSRTSTVNEGEFYRLQQYAGYMSSRRTIKFPSPSIKPEDMGHFMMPALWRKMRELSGGRIEGEHRPVTPVFIGIDGWLSNLAKIKNERSGIFRAINDDIISVFEIVDKYGGNVVRLDVSPYGERVMALFGAPVSRENAPSDAIRASLEMINTTPMKTSSLPVPVRKKIGINSGICYVGDVGGSYRREYTAMGKEVNLAARLMETAEWGEIVAGPSTLRACGHEFGIVEKGILQLKGLSDPIPIVNVTGIAEKIHSSGTSRKILGREKEISLIDSFCADAVNGKATICRIVGEAGTGKSVLMEIAGDRLLALGIALLKSACHEHTSQIPLHPLTGILRSALGIRDNDNKSARKEKLVKFLGHIEATEWEALVCRLAGYAIKPGPVINNLSENIKRDKTFQVIVSLLESHFESARGCVIIDDLQWADDTSLEFLNSYARRLTENGISIILVARPAAAIRGFDKEILISLGPLDSNSSQRLFNSVSGIDAPVSFVSEIVKMSGGNPFYLEEMAKAVRDMGIESWIENRAIPDSVERVITARIDRLDEMVKTTVRTASVIGRVFGVEDLKNIYPIAEKIPKIPSYLQKSADLDITPVERTEPALEYGFKHILTREVAYSGLSFKIRRRLHGALAGYYRKNRLMRVIAPELIGYHYENSDNPRLAAPFYLRAGLTASRSFSNSEAIHNFTRVIELIDTETYRNTACRAHLGLGRVYRLTGDYEKSESHLRYVETICPDDGLWNKDALKELSDLFRIRSEFDKASEILTKLLGMDPGNSALNVVYQHGMGDIARRKGKLDAALHHFTRALEFGGHTPYALQAQVLNNMGICLWTSGRLDESIKKYQKARNIYADNSDLQGTAKISNNIGIIFEQKGELSLAADCYGEAVEVFRKIGDRRSEGYCYGNLATNFILRGLHYRGKMFIDRALEIFERIDDREAYARTIGNVADWYEQIGVIDVARDYCRKTIEHATRLGNDELICETEIRLGRMMNVGEPNRASFALQKARKAALEHNWHELAVKAEYYLCENEFRREGGKGQRAVIDRLRGLLEKDPSPELRCGIYIMISLVNFRGGKVADSLSDLMRAYRVAVRSDLVIDRWKVLSVYGHLWPEGRRAASRRISTIEPRLFENLSPDIISSLRKTLLGWQSGIISTAKNAASVISVG